ncbi:MAG: O-antigen ligase family protein [Spirochaetota bacterium]
MKYFIFLGIMLAGIPIIGMVSARNATFRSLCWMGLVAFIALGDISGVNFVSTESYRGTDRGFELTFTDMFAFGLLLSRSLKAPLVEPSKKTVPPGFLVFCLFLALGLIGVLGSLMPLYGFFTIWKMVRMLFLYWLVWSAGRTEADPQVFYEGVLRGLIFGLLAVGLMGAKQKFVDHMYRVNSTFDHSNTIPLYVNLAAAPVFAWILGDHKMGRIQFFMGFGAVGAALVAVLATQSRLGILLAGVSVFTALLVSNGKAASKRSRAAAVVFVMASVIGGIMVSDTLLDRIKNAPESSAEARDEFNVAAKLMAADHFFGVGLNNFSITMTNVEKYRAQVEVMANEEQSGVAHHLYLLTAAETGYIGLALQVIVFALVQFTLLGFLLKRRSKAEKAALGFLPQVVIATMVGQYALFTSCFFEWAFRITPVISQYFTVSAIVCAAVSRSALSGESGLGLAFSRNKVAT